MKKNAYYAHQQSVVSRSKSSPPHRHTATPPASKKQKRKNKNEKDCYFHKDAPLDSKRQINAPYMVFGDELMSGDIPSLNENAITCFQKHPGFFTNEECFHVSHPVPRNYPLQDLGAV